MTNNKTKKLEDTKELREMLDSLSTSAKYNLIHSTSNIIPEEIVKEAIMFCREQGNKQFLKNSSCTGTQIGINMAKGAGLLDDLVNMLIEEGNLTAVIKYPEVVGKRKDLISIFGLLKQELKTQKFVNSRYRCNDASAKYAFNVCEFGIKTRVPKRKIKKLIKQTYRYVKDASKGKKGFVNGDMPFSIIERLGYVMKQYGFKTEANDLYQITLDRAETDFLYYTHSDVKVDAKYFIKIAKKLYSPTKAKEELLEMLEIKFEYYEEDEKKAIAENRIGDDSSFCSRKKLIEIMDEYGLPTVNEYKVKGVKRYI
ncbi:hypothetical protein HOK51_05230 [Candidatus Woesearchaeota archaeon]|jgi:phage anti-repressor protein|nr:hypothetical protein [Candidatus Woesearchaeota archaeon]MBT7367011.1 hypothetical protein [Candidatus Woesearchaeota archaeon]